MPHSPNGGEGEDAGLLRALKGQMAKWEQRQRVRRSTMGMREKVKQGEIMGTAFGPRYGFRYVKNDKGKSVAYSVDEEKMAVVRRILSMLADGASLHAVSDALERDRIPAPGGGKRWSRTTLRQIALDDVYLPHTFEEIAALVSLEGLFGRQFSPA